MKSQTVEKWMLVPIIGIILFVILYIISANYYPGGSNLHKMKEGFDWINNYWCDLLAKYSKNGQYNQGRIFSLSGMIILFSSIAVFWYYLPVCFHEQKLNTFIIRYTGTLSMMILIFIFTRFHDSIIWTGSAISAVPMTSTLSELKKYNLKKLYFLGWFCIFLITLNFFIYLTNWAITVLPVLQKITILLFLLWITLISLKCIEISKSELKNK